MKIFFKITIIVVAVIIFAVAIMFVFNICPPSGPWIMPPWCSNSNSGEINEPNINNNSDKVNVGEIKTNANNNSDEINVGEIGTNKNQNSVGSEDVTSAPDNSVVGSNFVGIERPDFQKGVVFGAMKWSADEKKYINQAINALSEFHVKWVSIVPEWFIFPDQNGTEIKPFYESSGEFPNKTGWITPTLSDDELVSIIKQIKNIGVNVVLKPQVDPIDFGMKDGSSRGSIKPTDWNVWFDNYKKFILHYAKLASEQGVKMFIIGTELDTVVRDMPQATQKWNDLIVAVKKVYAGPLTYSASCYGECWSPQQVTFWDNLDYIGFEPYFSLTNKNNPSVEEIKSAFDEKFNKFAKSLSNKYNKPVILTEANVYSYDGVNKHPLDPPMDGVKADPQEQADYYEALFQSIKDKEWIKGIYWWGWYLDSTDINSSYINDLYDPFVRKPAGEVLKKWY